MKHTQRVLVMHHPDSPYGIYSAHLPDWAGQVSWEYGNTEEEAIDKLLTRLALEKVSVYPKWVKVAL